MRAPGASLAASERASVVARRPPRLLASEPLRAAARSMRARGMCARGAAALLLLLLAAAPAAADAGADDAPRVYMLTLRGRAFGADPAAVSVRVNGAPAAHVLLHNDTALSFSVPDALIEDPAARDSSSVEVVVGTRRLSAVPLAVIHRAAVRVDPVQFERDARERVARAAEETASREADEASSPSSSDDSRGAGAASEEGKDGVVKGEPDEEDIGSAPNVSSGTGTSSDEDQPTSSVDDNDPGVEAPQLSEEQRALDEMYSRAEMLLGDTGRKDGAVRARSILEAAVELGDARSMAHLAWLLLTGDTPGITRDVETAVPLVQRAAAAGHPDGNAILGLLHASGFAEPAVLKDPGRAVLLWTVAAQAGSRYARTALAYRYFSGFDVAEDCERSASLYEEVARESIYATTRHHRIGRADENADGLAQIRPPTPRALQTADRRRLVDDMVARPLGEANEVIQYYKHAADRGDPVAQVMLGNLYYYGGANMPQDTARARRLFERAARAGRVDANAHLGFMELHAGRNESAVAYLQKAAKFEDKLGYHGMGYVTLHGIGVEKDEAKSAVYFLKAAELEHPEAMYNLGLMYTEGVGVEASREQAFRFFQEAARFGHQKSLYNIGIKRLRGIPPATRQCSLAVAKYLKEVAEQGIWNRVLSKALRAYERGDYGTAMFRYVHAAHAGIELAQYNAAYMFEHNLLYNQDSLFGQGGRGWSLNSLGDVEATSNVAETPALSSARSGRVGDGREWTRAAAVQEALDYYQMSSSQNHSPSLVRMGDLAYGEGKDYVRATHAYERASRMRNAEAAFNLGWMHAVGYISKPDANLAKRYFDLAKEHDRKALIPATIAVYLLRYHSTLLKLLDSWSRLTTGTERPFGKRGSWLDGQEHLNSSTPEAYLRALLSGGLWEQYGDIAIITVLVGVLGIVVNARQRRIVQGENADDLDLFNAPDDNANPIDDRVDDRVRPVQA